MKEQMGRIIGLLSMPWVLYLIFDALKTQSILIRGRGEELGGFARRVYRDEAPWTYWFFLCFYVGTVGLFSAMLF